jgi:hypothetical protein
MSRVIERLLLCGDIKNYTSRPSASIQIVCASFVLPPGLIHCSPPYNRKYRSRSLRAFNVSYSPLCSTSSPFFMQTNTWLNSQTSLVEPHVSANEERSVLVSCAYLFIRRVAVFLQAVFIALEFFARCSIVFRRLVRISNVAFTKYLLHLNIVVINFFDFFV